MRSMLTAAVALTVLMNTSCGGSGPTEKDINNSLDAALQSVSGDWIGMVNVPNAIQLEFRLQEGANGQVTGSGTMKEKNAAAAVPVTVTGTYQRPTLSLTFNGMVYESNQVTGVAQGNYTTVGGIATTLSLSGNGYARNVAILLQEK